jgi:hypothetical protein
VKKHITKAAARAFQKRWDTVNAEERKLLRRTPIARKRQQLNGLLAWGEYFGWREAQPNGAEEVRRRWIRLRQAYRG